MKKLAMAFLMLLAITGSVRAGWVPQVSGVGFWLRGVSFADSLVGIAVGDSQALLRTVDGGANWQIVASGVYGRGVDMVTSQIGWFVGGSVWKTTNGGLNWTPQGTGGQEVSFSDLQHGLVVGLGGYVNRTTNGGSTWVQETTNVKQDLFDVCMVDSLHAWAVGYDGGRDTTPIIVSRDGGQTWTRQSIPDSGSGTWDLTGISFSDTLHGLAVGGNQDIYRTNSGGTPWIQVNPLDAASKTEVDLVDSLWGWMVGTPTVGSLIERTTDGGSTWAVQYNSINHRLFDVSFTDRRNGWAVGDNGTIVHTTDGGAGVEEEPGDKRQRAERRITIRPNPFISFATIPGHAGDRFALFDNTGRLMGFYHGDRIGYDLKTGVYFIKLEGKDDRPIRIVKVR